MTRNHLPQIGKYRCIYGLIYGTLPAVVCSTVPPPPPTPPTSHTLPCEVLCTTTFACTIGPKCAAKFGQTLPWHAPYAKHFGCECECECSMWGVSASVPLTRLSSPNSRAKQAEQTAQQSTVCAINYAKFLPPTPTAARPPHLAPPLASELLLNNCANFQFMFLLVMVATPTRQQAGWQAGSRYESIRLLTFVIFLFCLPFPLLLVPSQPGRQAVRQSGCASAMLPRQQRPTITDSPWKCNFSCRKCVAPHTHAHTHTRAHLWQCLSNLHIAV